MEGQEKPEITLENREKELEAGLKPGQFGYVDGNGVLHAFGSIKEMSDQLESYREDQQ